MYVSVYVYVSITFIDKDIYPEYINSYYNSIISNFPKENNSDDK